MEKEYRNIGFVFLLFIPLTFLGFYKSYFFLSPEFVETFDVYTHIHAFVASIWMTLLIVQPLLIRYKNYKLHRFFGKFSYFILDEIQTGIGRTGTFWGFENYNVIPDIIITGKGLGGGMPIGAFIASYEHMSLLKDNPKLGHISTFTGHPVIAAAANATVTVTVTEIFEKDLLSESLRKEVIIRKYLQHSAIKEIRGKGLVLAAIVETPELAAKIIHKCLEKGLILFFLLFEGKAIRITPPLTISDDEIIDGCKILIEAIEEMI